MAWMHCSTCGELDQICTIRMPAGASVSCHRCASIRGALRTLETELLSPRRRRSPPSREAALALWNKLPVRADIKSDQVEEGLQQIEAALAAVWREGA